MAPFRSWSRGATRVTTVVALAGIAVVALLETRVGSPPAAPAAAPAPLLPPGDTAVIYGPVVLSTPNGNSTNHTERFPVTVVPGKRYVLRLVNGDASGGHRVTSGTVRLNGWETVTSAQLASGAAIDRVVQVRTEDTVFTTVQGSAGAYITVSVLETADASFLVLGPAHFIRTTGTPVTELRTFSIGATAAPPYRLCLTNGDVNGANRVSSATVLVNGQAAFTPNNFNQQVASLMTDVSLLHQAANTLSVTLAGVPGGFVDICITATDTTPPVLAITAPPPNFITGDTTVTVSGTVQDETPTTVTVNGQNAPVVSGGFTKTISLPIEGHNTIHVVATDAPGHTTDSTRVVIRDTQKPVLVVNSPADNSFTNQISTVVAGTIADSTAVTLNVNGIAIPVTNGAFNSPFTLTEGVNQLVFNATDAAGNSQSALRTVTRDTQNPVIAVTSPAENDTVATTSVTVIGTVTDATAVNLTVNGNAVTVGQGGSFTTTVNNLVIGVNTITLVATDQALNDTTFIRHVVRKSPLPPDPATVASVLNRAEVTTIGDATSFLYTGTNPIQTGVAANTINPVRAAVLRGRVLDRASQPLGGATVSIRSHPELGQTKSRADGGYDLAVNGGNQLTIAFTLAGYLPAQRTVDVQWQDYTRVADVILLRPDTVTTVVTLSAATPAVARSSTVSDADSARQVTVLFKPGNTATLTPPGGTPRSIDTLTVRATEFTVGTSGPLAMPAELPPASQYTYAVQVTADEQLAAGPGAKVTLAQPVPIYVRNFLNVPVGTKVPVGIYNSDSSAWIPKPDGIALKILGTDANGKAQIDITGDGVADPPTALAALGIDDYELLRLPGLFPAQSNLWRALVPTLEPLDLNFPFIFVGAPPSDGKVKGGCSSRDGDPLRCQLQAQTAFQRVGIVGSPFTLNYASDRTQGNVADRKLDITLTGPTLPAQLIRVDFEIDVAGQRFTGTFKPPELQPNLHYTFSWDGHDLYGRLLQGTQSATVLIGYVFPVQYAAPANTIDAFGLPCAPSGTGSVCPFIAQGQVPARAERTLVQRIETSIGTLDATALGLGGFTLDAQHVYDPIGQVMYQGNGTRRATAALPPGIRTVIGGCASSCLAIRDSGPALRAQIGQVGGMIFLPDGTMYFSDIASAAVRRVTPDGKIKTIAGGCGIGCGYNDGGPATNANLGMPKGLALGPDGSLYIGDGSGQSVVRRVLPNGIITTFAGTLNSFGFSGDSGPATAARFQVVSGIALGPDGSLYIGDRTRIRRVARDGIITTYAGTANVCDTRSFSFCGDGGLAKQARLGFVGDVKFGPDGNLYFSEIGFDFRVRRITPDGIIRTVAGSSVEPITGDVSSGDGGPATLAGLGSPASISFGPDGSWYIGEGATNGASNTFRVRRVTPNGIISTFAGTGVFATNPPQGDGGPAAAARLQRTPADMIGVGPDGNLYIGGGGRIRKVAGVLPGFGAGQTVIASADGRELMIFSAAGRLLQTLDAVTRDTIYNFGYNDARQLITITDRNGRITQIERDASGKPTALIAPNGQKTGVSFDPNGHIVAVSGPDSIPVRFLVDSGGLLGTSLNAFGDTISERRYDAEGLLDSVRNALGGVTTYTKTVSASQTDLVLRLPSGRMAFITYVPNAAGGDSLVSRLSGGMTQRIVKDGAGRITVTAFNGTVTTYTPSADPRFGMESPRGVEVVRLPSGLTRTRQVRRGVTLSDSTNLLSVLTQVDSVITNGRVRTVRFDNSASTATTTTAGGRSSVQNRDAQGRVTRVVVPGLPDQRSTFDALGRLTSSSIGGRTRSFGYDGLDRQTTDTDENGLVSTTTYDITGQITDTRSPDGSIVSFGYDDDGFVSSVTPPGRPAHSLSFNTAGRLTRYTAPDIGAGSRSVTLGYDAAGRLSSFTRADSSKVFVAYDSTSGTRTIKLTNDTVRLVLDSSTGRLVQASITNGATYSNVYDGGLLTARTWTGPFQATAAYSYDSDFRVQSEQINGDTPIQRGYDADGLVTSVGQLTLVRHSGTGRLTSSSIGSVQTAYDYTPGPEVSGIQVTYNADTLFADSFQRDSVGRIVSKTERIAGVTHVSAFTYDSAGRLILVTTDGVPVESYEYDSNGNRTHATTAAGTVTGVIDAQDRLTSYGNTTYQYAFDGERRRKIVGADTTTYTYDALGSLRQVVLPDHTVIDYVLDANGRRVGKKVNGVLVRGWIYNSRLAITAELDGSGQVITRFLYGERTNVPEYLVRSGTVYKVVTDQRGSVRLVVNVATGEIAQRLDYDAFGRVTLNTAPDFQPMGFAGGLYDHQTSLVRFGARDYDGQPGRWTTKDPLLFESGEPNVYAYVLNDPVNATDLTGLMSLPEEITVMEENEVAEETEISSSYEAIKTVQNVAQEVIPVTDGAAPAINPFAVTALFAVAALDIVIEALDAEAARCELNEECQQKWLDDQRWCFQRFRRRALQRCLRQADTNRGLCEGGFRTVPLWTEPPFVVR